MGGNTFACCASYEYGTCYAYKAFSTTVSNYWYAYGGQAPWYLSWYNPDPVKISNLHLTYYSDSSAQCPMGGSVYASNDNASWVEIATWSKSVTSPRVYWDIPIPAANRNFYNYYKLEITSVYNAGTGPIITDLSITGTYMYTPPSNILPVVGNNKVIGFTDGTTNYGSAFINTGTYAGIVPYGSNLNSSVSVSGSTIVDNTRPTNKASIGLSTDAALSGLVVDTALLKTFDPYFYIRY